MLSALIGPMLAFLTVVAVPVGLLPKQTMDYSRALAFAQSGIGKLALLVVISLFLFHGMHRLYHTLHDFGVHIGPGAKALCHGLAILGTLVTAYLLFKVGWS
jgi:fumarate reductase subunit D